MLALHVVTPEGKTLDQEVDEVTLPGLLGELGVLPGHLPLLSAVKAGVLRYRKGQERGVLAVGPGFAEVDGQNKVVALVQRALPSARISSEAADKLLADATERLKGDKNDRAAAEADRDFALAQLEAVKVSSSGACLADSQLASQASLSPLVLNVSSLVCLHERWQTGTTRNLHQQVSQ